jgi:hypothetical protein
MSALITLKTIIVYSFPCLALMGLITNLLLLIIFSRKTFQNTIFSTYFRVYLLIDTFNLIFPINTMFEFNLSMYFYLISDICCKLRRFFPSWTNAISPWLLVIISFDRYLSVAHPSKFTYRKKYIFQILTSCFVIGFNFCMFTPLWSFYLKENTINKTNQTVITYECVSTLYWIKFISLIQLRAIPFSLMFWFSLLTPVKIWPKGFTSKKNRIKYI